MTTARERMTKERLNELAFPVDSSDYLDIELPDDQTHEAVLLADALAYGADERADALLFAMKAICSNCDALTYEPATQPFTDGRWRHRSKITGAWAYCNALPIHDAIQAMRTGESM